MFGRIARRYDLMNRLMTLGRDHAWRRYTVQQLNFGSYARSKVVLDLATGTGDLAFEVLRQRPDVVVIGLDLTPEMLALARDKALSSPARPCFLAGDALRLPFSDAAFDGVVTGFALRNVADIPAAFAEMARVTQPGGRLACLEIAMPVRPLFRRFFQLYFYRLVPLLGMLISGQRAAYTYLPHSLTSFLTPDEIATVMRRTGWTGVHHCRLMMGTVAVHSGTRKFQARADVAL